MMIDENTFVDGCTLILYKADGSASLFSAFGQFEATEELLLHALRLKRRFGRIDYLGDWCKYQWEKMNRIVDAKEKICLNARGA